jgi:hypothetical protein
MQLFDLRLSFMRFRKSIWFLGPVLSKLSWAGLGPWSGGIENISGW